MSTNHARGYARAAVRDDYFGARKNAKIRKGSFLLSNKFHDTINTDGNIRYAVNKDISRMHIF